jgi:hypothetical protein
MLLHLESKIMRWARHIRSTYGKEEKSYRFLMGKPEGRRPLERPRRSWRIILKRIFRKGDGRGHGLD